MDRSKTRVRKTKKGRKWEAAQQPSSEGRERRRRRADARARRLRLVAVRVRGIVVVGGHWWSFLPAVMRGIRRRVTVAMAWRDKSHGRRIAVKSAGFVTAIRRLRGHLVGRFARFRVSAIGAHCLTSSYGAGLLFGGDSWVNVAKAKLK